MYGCSGQSSNPLFNIYLAATTTYQSWAHLTAIK